MDNPETEKIFKRIVAAIPSMQNGFTAESLEKRGLIYEKNFGASVVDLKEFAKKFERNHLLALKLWNKKWRETMILATLLEEADKVNEEQIDYWVKTAPNIEVIEQAIINLLVDTPYAFVKGLEWCRAKKTQVKQAGMLMMGRLALVAENSIDEMFEPYFEVIAPLAKDNQLHNIFYRTVCQLARRSENIHRQCVSFAGELITSENENAVRVGNELFNELSTADFKAIISRQMR